MQDQETPQEREALQVKQTTNVRRRGQESIEERVDSTRYPETDRPMLSNESVHYELSARNQGIVWGGLGLLRQFVKRLDVSQILDARVEVLKRHFPYHESDHVLSLIYNLLTGGRTLEDLEHRLVG